MPDPVLASQSEAQEFARQARGEAEQSAPIPNDSPAVADIAIAHLQRRKKIGMERYGVALQAHNGRDFLQDADEEMADFFIYWTGLRIEWDRRIRELLQTIGDLQEQTSRYRAALEAIAALPDSPAFQRLRQTIDEIAKEALR